MLKVCLIAFNKANIELSYKYSPVLSITTFNVYTSNNIVTLLGQFHTNMLPGLTEFATEFSDCTCDFSWYENSTLNQIVVERSYPLVISGLTLCQLRTAKVSIFYLKSWVCPPTNPYYSLTTQMCSDICPFYTYGSLSDQACVACEVGCHTCNDAVGCLSCNSADLITLAGIQCPCNSGYYPNPNGAALCVTCSSQMVNCTTCQKNSTSEAFICLTCSTGYAYTGSSCLLCTAITMCLKYSYNGTGCVCSSCQSGYAVSPTGTTCVTCNKTNCLTVAIVSGVCACTQCNSGYLYNGSSCSLCSDFMFQCLNCSSSSVCNSCKTVNGYFLNSSAKCQICSIAGCMTCANLTACQTCDTFSDYFLLPNLTCSMCTLNQCLDCLSLTQCLTCNSANSYFLNSTTQLCSPCSLSGIKRQQPPIRIGRMWF